MARFWLGSPYAQAGGAAYPFRRPALPAAQSFQNPALATTGRFGWSVAFCGDSVLVGRGNGAGSPPSGSAYAFRMDTGALEAELADPSAVGKRGIWLGRRQPGRSARCQRPLQRGWHGRCLHLRDPQPSTIALLLAGAVGLLFWRLTRGSLGVVLVTMLAASVAQAECRSGGWKAADWGRTNES